MDDSSAEEFVRGPHNTGVPGPDHVGKPLMDGGPFVVNLWLTRFGSMSEFHARAVVHFLNGRDLSVRDQADILIAMESEGIFPSHDGIRRNQAEHVLGVSLDYQASTSLDNLVQIGMLERDPEVFDDLRTFVIADWLGTDGEIVNGRVRQVAEEAIDAIIEHVHDTDPAGGDSEALADGSGVSLRRILARALDVDPPADIEERLREGDLVDNVRDAVEAIEDHPAVSTRDDYGMIRFRNEAYRYRLSDRAINLLRL